MEQVKSNQKCVVLAFDIEKAGGRSEHPVIGIGISVVDENLKELDSLLLKGYFLKETKFEKRCWDEFWTKNLDNLDCLVYDGTLNFEARQKEMIEEFQSFRKKWETKCEELGVELLLVTDNNVYDGGFINLMICKHLDEIMPIPYSANEKQKYNTFFETHSQQKGFLMAMDPGVKRNWGLHKRITEIYDTPSIERDHDHNPSNDAYVIACEQQILFGISNGVIHKKVEVGWEWSASEKDIIVARR